METGACKLNGAIMGRASPNNPLPSYSKVSLRGNDVDGGGNDGTVVLGGGQRLVPIWEAESPRGCLQ